MNVTLVARMRASRCSTATERAHAVLPFHQLDEDVLETGAADFDAQHAARA